MDTLKIQALATSALLVPQMAPLLRNIAGVVKLTTADAGTLAYALNGLLQPQDTMATQEAADSAADVLAGMLGAFAVVSRVAVNGDVWIRIGAPRSLVHEMCGQSVFAGCVYRVAVHVAGVAIPALSHLQGVESEDGEQDTAWRVPASAMRDGVVSTWANFHHASIFDTLTN